MIDHAARLEELLAKQDITEIIYTLARGLDRCDPAIIASAYHPDATDDHGMIRGTFDEFLAAVIPMLKGMRSTQHLIGNILIRVTGEEARGEAYFIAQHSVSDPSGEPIEMFAAGRYLDRFTRRDGAWRIAHRQAVYDWTMSVPASRAWDAGPMHALLQRGTRSEDDLSYSHFAGLSI